jgi:hypothetical protein
MKVAYLLASQRSVYKRFIGICILQNFRKAIFVFLFGSLLLIFIFCCYETIFAKLIVLQTKYDTEVRNIFPCISSNICHTEELFYLN